MLTIFFAWVNIKAEDCLFIMTLVFTSGMGGNFFLTLIQIWLRDRGKSSGNSKG